MDDECHVGELPSRTPKMRAKEERSSPVSKASPSKRPVATRHGALLVMVSQVSQIDSFAVIGQRSVAEVAVVRGMSGQVLPSRGVPVVA